MDETTHELFDIRIGETGAFYVGKVFRLLTVIYVLMGLVTLMTLTIDIYSIILNSKVGASSRLFNWRVRIYPYLFAIIQIGNLIGFIYFWKFVRNIYRGLATLNQSMVNNSFKYLYRNSIVFIIVISLSFFVDTLTITNLLFRFF